MVREDYGFYGYKETYRFGTIYVMSAESEDKERYTLLELKGQGCRLFECHLAALGWTWYDFFQHCLDNFPIRVKRLDIAVDDIDGLLSVPMLVQKKERGEFESRWIRRFSSYNSGERLTWEEQNKRMLMGETLYIGSVKSELYCCVYEKDYEQHIKAGVDLDLAQVKNRFEIRLKNDRALKALEDLAFRRDVDTTFFEILSRYIAFVDYVDGEQVLNPRWAKFMGDGRGELKLTVKPEPYTVERTKKWFQKQVAPSLNLLLALDEVEDTNFVSDTLGAASLSERQARILKQIAWFKKSEYMQENEK
jgi:phage replication initiation protein